MKKPWLIGLGFLLFSIHYSGVPLTNTPRECAGLTRGFASQGLDRIFCFGSCYPAGKDSDLPSDLVFGNLLKSGLYGNDALRARSLIHRSSEARQCHVDLLPVASSSKYVAISLILGSTSSFIRRSIGSATSGL